MAVWNQPCSRPVAVVDHHPIAGRVLRKSDRPGPGRDWSAAQNKGNLEKIDRSLFTIGKPGENVAVIARRPQGFYLLHIGGSSFPRINNKEIDSKGGVQLQEGDMVEVGEYMAEISFAQ